MRRLSAVVAALTVAFVTVFMLAGGLSAQPDDDPSRQSLSATAERLCDGTGSIEAERLGRTKFPPGLCDLRGRVLSDHGIGAKVPPPGQQGQRHG